ncbi:type III pantothenate kinase [Pedobacter sp. ASV28]|uniref:type III pantothenate kinase n=1 Tax=Pedobacter sp. ASV28 TaxID=2795123 RepID=UPI0018EE2539|nr:type III pantothenate kinase [Pedobacter sp. ASV28]
MHNLVIDIGNTYSKLAVFDQKELIYFEQLGKIDQPYLIEIIAKYKIENATISSVSDNISEIEHLLKEKLNYTRFTTAITSGVKNNYKSPETLGLDRWAKVIAAHYLYRGINCLMIDAGTCITYDILNAQNEYFGGSISLGLNMRFKALNHYTERLPLVQWDKSEEEIPLGADTETSIKNGVLRGALNEVEGFIQQANRENKDLKVILTGGDAVFLNKQLKNSIFAAQIIHEPYLVLKGLNEVIIR